jgi:predicted secreted protein
MAMNSSPQTTSLSNLERRKSLAWAASAWLASSTLNVHAADMTALSTEGIDLVFPRLADTGNAVPLQASIQAPAGVHLQSIRIILPENPNPLALQLKVYGEPKSYQLNTRLRLAASQSVWVVASFSNGVQRANSAPTVITSTACLDDS